VENDTEEFESRAGHTENFKNGTCGLLSLVFGVNGCVQEGSQPADIFEGANPLELVVVPTGP